MVHLTYSSPHRNAAPPRAGFALLITIVLMAFLVLLVVSMASLTRVEIQIAANSQLEAKARSNALMALNIALGQLQQHVGPDQRTTARADILDATNAVPVANRTVTGTSSWSTNVTGLGGTVYHNNTMLTGVWGNAVTTFNPIGNSAYVNTPQLLTWLVSGNESVSYTQANTAADFAAKSADSFVSNFGRISAVTTQPKVLANKNYDNLASADKPSSAKPVVQLVGAATVGAPEVLRADGTKNKDWMVAAITQPITVPASQIPGLGSGSTLTPIGRYAYWVGDEGIKAKFNMPLPDALANAPMGTTADEIKLRSRYQTAQRNGIELMTTDGTAPIGPTTYDQSSSLGRANIEKTISYNSLQAGSMLSATAAQNRFHDLTTYSQGVMTNVLNGGLKKDLTAAFGAPAADLPDALDYKTTDLTPVKKLWHITSATMGAGIYTTNMVAKSAMLPGQDTDTYDGLGPDWKVLRSFYRLATDYTYVEPTTSAVSTKAIVMTGEGNAVSMDPIAPVAIDPVSKLLAAVKTAASTQTTQMGVFPVIAGFKLFHSTRLLDSGLIGTEPAYQLELKHIPVIILWNPYNVTLKSKTYCFQIEVFNSQSNSNIVFARVTNAVGLNNPFTVLQPINTAAQVSSPYLYNSTVPLRFEVDSGPLGIGPGKAIVYSMQGDIDSAIADPTKAITSAGKFVLKQDWTKGGEKGYGIYTRSDRFTNIDAPVTTSRFLVYANFSSARSGVPPAALSPLSTRPLAINQVTGPTNTYRYHKIMMRLDTPTGPLLQTCIGSDEGTPSNQNVKVSLSFSTSPPTPTDFGPWSGVSEILSNNSLPSPSSQRQWIADMNPRSGFSSVTRWESVNSSIAGTTKFNTSFINTGNSSTTGGALLLAELDGGMSDPAYSVSGVGLGPTVLFDIPRLNHPIQSIGALQHADVYRSNFTTTNIFYYRFQSNTDPAYPIGNSQKPLRIPKELPYYVTTGGGAPTTSGTRNVHYDHSFMANRALWDGYFFSTVPVAGATVNFPLSNSRHVLASEAKPATDAADLRNFDKAASRLLIDGGFNINSTSVEAWRAVLSSTMNAPVGAEKFDYDTSPTAPQVPVPRLLYPIEDSAVMSATNLAEDEANTYLGYRALTSAQISTLATAIVAQVKARGPFVSLADFVNRALVDTTSSANTTTDQRWGGALYTAINGAGINSGTGSPFGNGEKVKVVDKNSEKLPDLALFLLSLNDTNRNSTRAAGLPGWVTQADLLQVLGPVLSARSDTFVVRVYGEVLDPLLTDTDAKRVQSRAWAEAIVQRTPNYIDQNDTALAALGDSTHPSALVDNTPNKQFGRRLKIISFRWLSPSDI